MNKKCELWFSEDSGVLKMRLFLIPILIMIIILSSCTKNNIKTPLIMDADTELIKLKPLMESKNLKEYESGVRQSLIVYKKYYNKGVIDFKKGIGASLIRLALLEGQKKNYILFNSHLNKGLEAYQFEKKLESVSRVFEWVIKSNTNYGRSLDEYKSFWNKDNSIEENKKLLKKSNIIHFSQIEF